MKNLFVPYALALKAKEAGFDEECFGIYTWDFGVPSSPIYKLEDNKITGGECIPNYSSFAFAFDSIFRRESVSNSQIAHIKLSDGNQQNIAAPLYSQIVDWFREKHNIHISITPIADWVHQNDEFSPNGFFSALLEDVTVGKVFHASNTIGLVSDKYNYKQALIAGLEKAFELIKK